MLSHRAMRNALVVSAKRAFFSSEKELFISTRRRKRDFVSSSASSFPEHAAKFECWSCFTEQQQEQPERGKEEDREEISFFCKKCDAIKHPNTFNKVSHYRLLSVPERFSVDKKQVELSMKNLQKILHPDKFSSAGQMKREKEYAEEISARVNEAYGKLRDPLLRAKYLFGLKTGAAYDGTEEMEKNGDEAREEVPPELLFLVMEVREAIEDADEDGKELIKLKEENEERMEEAERRVGEALDDEVEFDAEKARKAIVELTYFEKIRKEIIERL